MTFTLDGVWFSISRRRPIKRYLMDYIRSLKHLNFQRILRSEGFKLGINSSSFSLVAVLRRTDVNNGE